MLARKRKWKEERQLAKEGDQRLSVSSHCLLSFLSALFWSCGGPYWKEKESEGGSAHFAPGRSERRGTVWALSDARSAEQTENSCLEGSPAVPVGGEREKATAHAGVSARQAAFLFNGRGSASASLASLQIASTKTRKVLSGAETGRL
jgi:hypothetical protein